MHSGFDVRRRQHHLFLRARALKIELETFLDRSVYVDRSEQAHVLAL